MTTPITTPKPDPRTAPDDQATEDESRAPANRGVSAEDPAEGADDEPARTEGSPKG